MQHRPALVLAVSAALVAGVGGSGSASADPVEVNPNWSQLRQDTVSRADKALNNVRTFKLAGSSTLHDSRVLPAQNRNVLEKDGSNDNRVVFNGYNGNSWCGSFVAAMWTGKNMPDPASYPRIPTNYESSQAWATDPKVQDLFTPFTGPNQKLPRPGDVVVWKDNDSSWSGHVGLVVEIDTQTRRVDTVEGNVDGDEIARKSYVWGDDGLQRAGKTFRGYTSRE